MAARPARPYSIANRQRVVDAGRERILAAARALLEADDAEAFSIDAVARRAKVARMTVYNQFESKRGLLEALFDTIAADAFSAMPAVFAEKDPVAALDACIALFGRFWTTSQRAHARLHAASEGDAELAAAMRARNERRREVLTALVKRLGPSLRPVVPKTELVNVLYVLLGQQTFTALAGDERTPADVVPLVRRLVHGILGLDRSG